MKVSVVIPVYNEAATIAQVVDRVQAVDIASPRHGLDGAKEIIIVNDCSTDGTGAVVDRLGAERPGIRVFHHERNQGKGAALRTGFGHVTGDIVIIQDADLEVDPGEFPKLLAPILAGEAEVVYGSRFLGRSIVRDFSTHYFGNWVLTRFTNLVSGSRVTDMETCYKVFRSRLLADIRIRSDRFGVEPEFTVKVARRGIPIREVPIGYAARSYADGKKITWKDGVKALGAILYFRFFD